VSENAAVHELVSGHGVLAVVQGPWHGARKLFIPIFKTVELALSLVFVFPDSSENFNFTAKYHGEAISSDGLIDTRKTCPVTPFVEFPAKRIGLEFENT
jgi:hypothetical protein